MSKTKMGKTKKLKAPYTKVKRQKTKPVVASKLSAKRIGPMRRSVAAVKAAPLKSECATSSTPPSKLAILFGLLSRPKGASMDDMTAATNWQKHTVRGALSGTFRKKRGYQIVSEKTKEGKRIYKITGHSEDDH